MIEARCPSLSNNIEAFRLLSNEAVELFIKYIYLDLNQTDLTRVAIRALFEVWRLAIDMVYYHILLLYDISIIIISKIYFPLFCNIMSSVIHKLLKFRKYID